MRLTLYLAPCFHGWGNFAEIVRRRKITLGFVLWIYLPSVERDVFGTRASSVCLKNNAAFNAVITEGFAYEL